MDNLRPTPRPSAPRTLLGRLTLGALAAALLLSWPLAGPAYGGASDYPSSLYLSSATSTQASTPVSHRLVPSGGAIGANPTAARTTVAGGTLSGTYTYTYTIVDANGIEGAPTAGTSASVNVTTFCAGCNAITVGNLPTGGQTLRIYRRASARFQLLREIPNNTSATWVDNGSNTVGALIPQPENRVAVGATGFAPFYPATAVSADVNDNTALTAAAPTTPSGRGWIVDGPGNVYFADGQWVFTLRVRLFGGAPGGVGELRAAMWAVETSGGSITGTPRLVLDANASGDETAKENLSGASAVTTVDYRVSVDAFQLAPGERLYVEFFRYQTAAYTSSPGGEARITQLQIYDGTGRIAHAGVTTVPDAPALAAPADGAASNTVPLLSAGYDDADGDAGDVEFRVCSDAACTAVLDTQTDAVADGATASVSIGTPLAAGTYYWQARAIDSVGGVSAWSEARSFRVNAAPSRAVALAPAPGFELRDSTPGLSAVYADDADGGTVHFRICRTAGPAGALCAELVRNGASDLVAGGTRASWSPATPLADGTYHWQARTRDALGLASPWTATRKLVIERRLVRVVGERYLTCVVGATAEPKLYLAKGASVTARLYTQSRLDDVVRFGRRKAGRSAYDIPLSWALARPAEYWVKLTAVRSGERDAAWLRVDVKPYRGGTPTCSAGS